jgi:hypothetical protein
MCREIVKGNCAVVNFFTTSHIWFAASLNQKNKYSFQSLCESRWYSMAKVCLSITYYQPFLLNAAEVNGNDEEHPRISFDVTKYITDHHFVNNNKLVKIIKPIADLIGQLEKATTNIAKIMIEFIKLHLYYKTLSNHWCNKNQLWMMCSLFYLGDSSSTSIIPFMLLVCFYRLHIVILLLANIFLTTTF